MFTFQPQCSIKNWQAFTKTCMVLGYGHQFGAMAHSAEPNPELWPIARKSSQIFTAWLHSTQWPIAHNQSAAVAHRAQPNAPQQLIAHHQIRCSGPQRITKFAAVAHSASPNSLQWPIAHHQIRCSGPQRITNSLQWPITHDQICRGGLQRERTLKVESLENLNLYSKLLQITN